MSWLKTNLKIIRAKSQEMLRDDELRKRLLFFMMNAALAFVSLYMTVTNFITNEHMLMMVTFIYMTFCMINLFLCLFFPKLGKLVYTLFYFECIFVLMFFIISGIPNGFSALWTCLVPGFSLLVFGRRDGSIFSGLTFLMLMFFLWTPFGQSLLMYEYTKEFMLRFPLFYIAEYIILFMVETIRAATQTRLVKAESEYYYLYRHDELTGVYNRYGFYEALRENGLVRNETTGALMIDIDDFKVINDTYGHNCGDKILMMVSGVITSTLCEDSVFCRWGGEEFVVFLNCSHDYEKIAEELRANIEAKEFNCDDITARITVSIGLCMTNDPDAKIEDIVNIADKCMYDAKSSGKNCVKIEII